MPKLEKLYQLYNKTKNCNNNLKNVIAKQWPNEKKLGVCRSKTYFIAARPAVGGNCVSSFDYGCPI